jgi:hypothetical protein
VKTIRSLSLATLLFAPIGALTCRAATVTETFDSYADGTALTDVGGGGVWTSGQNTVVGGGGVNGSDGLSTGSPIFNWKAQPFQWSSLVNGAKVAMCLDFQSSPTGTFDDDRVGWTVDADSSTSTANQFALQLDTPEGGMTVYWNSTRTVLNALTGIKNSTWYRFQVEFTKLGATNASIVGTLTELDPSGNPTGTPYVGTVTNTATFANPPEAARFTSTYQWPSFKNFNVATGNADNATFTYTPPYRSYTGAPITENFDGLGPTGTNVALLTGWDAGHFNPIINQGTTGGDGVTTVTDAVVVDNGSHDPGGTPMLANFGTSGASDRALGSFARTSAGDQFLQLAIKNESGSPITSFVLTYTGEQWRSPQCTSPQPLTVWYSGTSATNGFVSMGTTFTFYSPNNTASNVPLDGNAAGNRTVISATYVPATSIAAGSTFYIRWYDINENGCSDDFLAIDDLTVTPASAPQPLTVGITIPANNATVGTHFAINAAVAGGSGIVTNVYFYDGSTLLGNDDTGPAYSYVWNSAPPGGHALTAVAWDNTGLAATSAVVNATIRPRQVEYVIVISVDGMGSAYVTPLLTNGLLNELTTFKRFQAEGTGTLNARDDADYAVTLPNHVAMMTGRGVNGPSGHGWTLNGYPDGTNTTLKMKKGSYVVSGFDVAHDNGLHTGIWAGKPKFDLFQQSYSATSGGLDTTGPDNGRDKIDYDKIEESIAASALTADFTNQMTAYPFNFVFLHYQDPDTTGHSSGWSTDPTSAYATTLKAVDTQIGKIIQMVTNTPMLQGKTAIILTADHGGHGTTHGDTTNPLDYTIPFYVWGPGVAAGTDLYAVNTLTRTSPAADANPPYTGSQPIRNGDSANLAMALLDLDPVPASTIGSPTNKLAFAIAATPSVLAIVSSGGNSMTVTFAGTPGAQYRVVATTNLAVQGSWVSVSTNTVGQAGRWTYTDNASASSVQRFFRAARP